MDKKETKQVNKKTLEGVVASNKMDKTVKVIVEVPQAHPVYHKVVSTRKTYFAHTEEEIEEGATVTIRESRPFSKNVRWVVVKVHGA